MDVVILAAGKGSRLNPITNDIPKCMVPVDGKPIIKHIYDNLLVSMHELDIHKCHIYIITGYKEEVVHEYAKKNLGGSICITQKRLDGTASAIELTKPYILGDFIVLSGDTIFPVEDIIKLVENKNSLLFTELFHGLDRYGTMEVNPQGGKFRIHKINEKQTNPTTGYVNCGAYHFSNDIYEYIEKIGWDKRFGEKIITNAINLYVGKKDFYGIYVNDLLDITFPKDIKNVESRLNER